MGFNLVLLKVTVAGALSEAAVRCQKSYNKGNGETGQKAGRP